MALDDPGWAAARHRLPDASGRHAFRSLWSRLRPLKFRKYEEADELPFPGKELLLGLLLLLAGVLLGMRVLLNWGAAGFGTLDAVQNAMAAMILSILGIQTIFSGMFISLLLLNSGQQEG